MTTVSQTPGSGQIRVLPLYEAPQSTVYVDKDGDTWVPNGHTPSGELLLACPQPLNPEDAGVGESFAWTLGLVQAQFGPLMGQSAVSA
ncbi:hypothetical protein [Streptomyces sp. S1D4-20]|uniref:hypothetical protein n=1 Tax=Streptomyces sp. S1D4-20 TaxID=2594462 RepID=UPI00116538B3|nr:hypothetical protein [Streptomyces sp. S1D4-20]QDN57336.1 hypothetical protein FNV67_20130 [Streptomyces sp. S1D4-20]